MRRSKLVSAMAVLACGALVLSACGGGDSGGAGTGVTQDQRPADIGDDQEFTRPEVADSGEFTMVREGAFRDYNNNTGAANNFQNTVVLSNLQLSPYFFDLVDGQIVIKLDKDLMESVTVVSEDPLKIEWRINQEAVWSDGEPVACKDFYLYWMASVSEATTTGEDGSAASIWDLGPTGYDQITSLTCSDEGKTVTTDFSEPFADYRSLFTNLLPAHVLEREAGIEDITTMTPQDTGEEVTRAAEFYTTGWVGYDPELSLSNGPFTIESANDDEVVLVRNDRWWGNPAGPSKITIRVNNDAQSAAQQLQNREVDIIAIQADGAVAQQLRGDSSIKTFAAPGQTYEHIDFRMDHPVLQDKAVRQAISACINRQDLVDKLVKDVDPNAKPLGNVMFMPNEAGYEDHYANTGNGDVDAAKKILEDAGYTLGADGIYEKGGQKVTFRLGHRIVERRSQTVRLAQSHCRPAGIDIQDDQTENFNDTRLPASDFDAALFAWVGTAVKSSSRGNYVCREAGGSANYNRYCNPEMDKTYDEANRELDYDARTTLLNEVDSIMAADAHMLPLFVLPDFAAAQSTLSDITYVGALGGVTWDAFKWEKTG